MWYYVAENVMKEYIGSINMDNKKIVRKVILTINREMLTFVIFNHSIFYTDRKLKALIRILPKPKNLIRVIQNSRNRVPMFLLDLFKFTPEEMQEYENAKTNEDLANIIIKDGAKNGCILVANGDLQVDDFIASQIEKVEVVA